MRVHDLKCWPGPFEAVLSGSKRDEFRRDDRAFEVGDLLLLREWTPSEIGADYTGRMALLWVTHLSRGPEWGIPEGHVVMSIAEARVQLTGTEGG